MKRVDPAVVKTAMTYESYRRLTDQLLSEHKTTGQNHSQAYLQYTRMNVVRMNRLDKTVRLTEKSQQILRAIRRPLTWLVLTEAWCGDAAQIIPVLHQMARSNEFIDLRLILRDEHPAIMNAFLTDGARSIPKLIILDTQSLEVLGSWGPRPAEAQRMMKEYKEAVAGMDSAAERKEIYQSFAREMQRWYARDKTRSIQQEVLTTLLVSQPVVTKTG